MTHEEADYLLHHLKYQLLDAGFQAAAIEVENAQLHIHRLDIQNCKELARHYLPKDRHGRCKLILRAPFEARGLALLFGILNSIGET